MSELYCFCGYPKKEHAYNGACYGLCGEFNPTPVSSLRVQVEALEATNKALVEAMAFYEKRENWVMEQWVNVDQKEPMPPTRFSFNDDHQIALLSRAAGIIVQNGNIKYTGLGPAVDFGKRAREALGDTE